MARRKIAKYRVGDLVSVADVVDEGRPGRITHVIIKYRVEYPVPVASKTTKDGTKSPVWTVPEDLGIKLTQKGRLPAKRRSRTQLIKTRLEDIVATATVDAALQEET